MLWRNARGEPSRSLATYKMRLPEDSFVNYEPESRADFDTAEESAAEISESPEERCAEVTSFVDAMLSAEGVLSDAAVKSGRQYEFRKQQLLMAQRIAYALCVGKNLCVEAPTGVGKSFAYLIPAIKFASRSMSPVVITTDTIHLQEQLVEKDLPFLASICGVDFSFCLAKGRGNYLCKRRLEMLTDDRREQLLPNASTILELERIMEWSQVSADGDADAGGLTVDPAVWQLVCSEAGNCLGGRCQHFRRCFYFRAREKWGQCDVIVANHALFLTDLRIRQSGDIAAALLPRYSAVVIDEAHTLEGNAVDQLGLDLSQIGMFAWLNRLFHPESGRGLLVRAGEQELALRNIINGLRGEIRGFFRLFAEFLRSGGDPSIRRVTQPHLFPDTISMPLLQLGRGLHQLADLHESDENKDYKCELDSHILRCEAYLDAIDTFISMRNPDFVYWVEKRSEAIALKAAPVNVAPLLDSMLFKLPIPVVLTSATLTVNQSFDYYLGRIGFSTGETLQLDSPFSPEQVGLFLSYDIPEPSQREYEELLPQLIANAVTASKGRAFVLFTNYSDMRRCASELRGFFSDSGIRLLVQGDGLRRNAMLKVFREDIDSVLFGVDSFWTGVDVPGEALSNVIITKLPFPVPSHPLNEARAELIKAANKNPFMCYALPEAILKFRQGVGRLIRSAADRGMIFVLDSRVLTKRYGAAFIDSLPPYPKNYL